MKNLKPEFEEPCDNVPIKRKCHKIFCFRFFHESSFPKPLIFLVAAFQIYSLICEDIWNSRCTTGVNYTGNWVAIYTCRMNFIAVDTWQSYFDSPCLKKLDFQNIWPHRIKGSTLHLVEKVQPSAPSDGWQATECMVWGWGKCGFTVHISLYLSQCPD